MFVQSEYKYKKKFYLGKLSYMRGKISTSTTYCFLKVTKAYIGWECPLKFTLDIAPNLSNACSISDEVMSVGRPPIQMVPLGITTPCWKRKDVLVGVWPIRRGMLKTLERGIEGWGCDNVWWGKI